jgi:hypothetical protein
MQISQILLINLAAVIVYGFVSWLGWVVYYEKRRQRLQEHFGPYEQTIRNEKPKRAA